MFLCAIEYQISFHVLMMGLLSHGKWECWDARAALPPWSGNLLQEPHMLHRGKQSCGTKKMLESCKLKSISLSYPTSHLLSSAELS